MIHRSALARLMDLTMVPLLEDRLRELTSTCPFFRANESAAFILTLSNTRHYRENDRGEPLIVCLPFLSVFLTGGLISAGRQFIPSGSIREHECPRVSGKTSRRRRLLPYDVIKTHSETSPFFSLKWRDRKITTRTI